MRNFKKTARVLIVTAVTGLLLYALDFFLYPCTFIRNDIHAVITKTFDDIYLGASYGKINIDPSSIQTVSGRTGHNLCVGGEYSIDSYYLAKLILEKGHKPKRIVYEISPGYYVREKEEGNNYLLFYHEFPLSMTKLSYFKDCIAKCNFRTMFFPWYEYPLSYELNNLGDTVTRKWNRDYSNQGMKTEAQEYHEDGFIERYPVDPATFSFNGLSPVYPEDLLPESMEYLTKLVEYCKDNDIEFVAVTTPLPAVKLREFSESYEALGAYFEDYFAGLGVRYINFNNRQYYSLTDHSVERFTDLDGHMNGDAARAFSKVLAEQLEA